MKKVAVIIKHPYRDNDYRVDIYEMPEDYNPVDLMKAVNLKMLGPFEVIAITERINLFATI